MKRKDNNSFLLIFGTWISKFGNIIFDYANNVWLAYNSGFGLTALAFYQSSEAIVNIMLNVFGGVVSDRKRRKVILFVTDFISFMSCLITSLFFKSSFGFICIMSVNIILAITTSFSSPAYKAIVKDALDKDRINTYNSTANAGAEIIKLTGPMIALLIVNIVGTQGALLITSISFLVSAVTKLLLFIDEQKFDTNVEKHNFFIDVKNGFIYLINEKEIMFIIIVSMFVNFFLSGYNLMLPYTNNILTVMRPDMYGKLLSAEAFGGIVGSIINSRLYLPDTIRNQFFFLSGCGLSLIFFSVSIILGFSAYVLLASIFAFGGFLTIYNIQFISLVQNRVSSDYIGRVFSIIFTFSILFMPVGSFIFANIFKPKQTISFFVFGLGILILSIISIFISYMNENTKIKNEK